MKQTAVEWLFEQVVNRTERVYFLKELEQAKAMEKEQMELCYKVGIIDGNNGEILNFEQYYNETFNKNKMEEECCSKCGELENIHTNYDWSKKDRPVEEYLCNECGTYFKNKNNETDSI